MRERMKFTNKESASYKKIAIPNFSKTLAINCIQILIFYFQSIARWAMFYLPNGGIHEPIQGYKRV